MVWQVHHRRQQLHWQQLKQSGLRSRHPSHRQLLVPPWAVLLLPQLLQLLLLLALQQWLLLLQTL